MHEFRDCARVQVSKQANSFSVYSDSLEKIKINVCLTLSCQKFTCVTCSATFNGKEELRLHVVSHTGDMPHKVRYPNGTQSMTPIFQSHFPNVDLTPRTSSLVVGYENEEIFPFYKIFSLTSLLFSAPFVLNNLCARKV